jgi:hypothetical protein
LPGDYGDDRLENGTASDMTINLYAAWIGFLLGSFAGATTGLFFHDENWLGGYTDWRRRMLRLGHISLFGIGFLNLAFALTVDALDMQVGVRLPAYLLLVGAVAMPLVCYLSALRKSFRHLFFVPAGAVTLATAIFVWRLATR